MRDASPRAVEKDVVIVNTGCCHDCGGRCVLKAHVKDGSASILRSGSSIPCGGLARGARVNSNR